MKPSSSMVAWYLGLGSHSPKALKPHSFRTVSPLTSPLTKFVCQSCCGTKFETKAKVCLWHSSSNCQRLEAPILFIIEKLTAVLYSIQLKWEPHGQVTTWGEASMILHLPPTTVQHGVQQSFGLQRKGVVQKLSEVVSGTVTAEWEQWVDAHSPNARSVLRSLFPALLYKSLLYALTQRDVVAN